MAKRSVRAVPLISMVVAGGASAFGCQLLYDKEKLELAAGGGAGGTTTSAGGGGATTTSTTSTTTSTSSAGGGGAGGTGGSTTSMGGGGTGGTGGTGGSMTTTTVVCDDPLFVLATSATEVLCAHYSPMSGWTSSPRATGSSTARPAAALLDAQTGVGVFYQGGATGPLRAVEVAGGACGAPADVLAVTTKAAPSLAVLGGQVRALFQGAVGMGTDHPFVTAWDPVTKWAAPAQIDMNVFSQAVAGLGASGAEMLAAYGGGDDNLYRVRFAGAAWQLPAACFVDAGGACEQANKVITPAIAGLDAGGWLVVFQEEASATQLRWLTATAAGNAPAQALAGASSSSPVALARVEGGAVLAFRGTDENVYAAVYESSTGTWGPIQPIGGGSTAVSPAVAAGTCTHRAELVYVEKSDGSIQHASLENGSWSPPAAVAGANLSGVAIAGVP
jgi:hypothetical protein